jgi:TonB family protein
MENQQLNFLHGVSLFAQRFVVVLDTGEGVVYAPAAGWDRVYLLWTFRNFRSLPQAVLSPRQQRFMEALYRDASSHPANQLYDAPAVGRIEDFDPSSISALPSPVKKQPFFARFAFHRMTLKVGAGALVALIAILTWHQLGAQPISSSRLTQAVANPQSSNEPISIVHEVAVKDLVVPIKDLSPAPVQPASNPRVALSSTNQIASAESIKAAPVSAIAATEMPMKPLAKASVVSSKREPNTLAANANHPVAVSDEASADVPRMQISGRPQKLVYPVCPETEARGKVSLQAVVAYDGAVSRVRVLTGNRVLAAAAVQAVRQWRYEPSSGAAQRLERETKITVSFISSEVVAVSFPDSAPLSR